MNNKGFTLLEVLIVAGVLVVLSTISVGFYRNYVKDTSFQSFSETLLSDLKDVRNKSMTGEYGRKWGLHLVNGVQDYYEVFSTPNTYEDPTASISFSVFLPISVKFTDPTEGSVKNVIFDRIKGTANQASISLMFETTVRNIMIKSNGTIY